MINENLAVCLNEDIAKKLIVLSNGHINEDGYDQIVTVIRHDIKN